MSVTHEAVDIRPTSDVYSTYRRLSYTTWNAIAEFVDNSTQSYDDYRDELTAAASDPPVLRIDIYHDYRARTLAIHDNAFGMERDEMLRAVQLNRPPDNPHRRNRYGMGLKTAACWFGARWSIRSTQLGSENEYAVNVNVDELAETRPESLAMQIRDGVDPDAHYTIIEIEDMYRVIQRGGVARVREQLQSMYRRDLASGEIEIYYNEDPLAWEPDPIYEEPQPDGTTLTWRKDFSFDVDTDDGVMPVAGWVGIRRGGRARNAGFQLFQADRIVVGGPGQGWKPHDIFGAPNSFRSQRLLGELDLEGWPVSQTKDAFLWDGGLEEALVETLATEITDYSQKAEDIRAAHLSDLPRPTSAEAETVADEIEQDLSNEEIETALLIIAEEPLPEDPTPEEELEALDIAVADAGEPALVELGRDGHPTFRVWFLENAHQDSLYMDMASPQDDEIHMYVNLNHPFVGEIIGRDLNALRVYTHMLFADALVERALRRRGERTRPYRIMKDRMLRSIRAHRELRAGRSSRAQAVMQTALPKLR